jgi:hypothetical protein
MAAPVCVSAGRSADSNDAADELRFIGGERYDDRRDSQVPLLLEGRRARVERAWKHDDQPCQQWNE